MSAVEKVIQQLMDYLACVGHPGRVFGPRDFNSQVMHNVFDDESRGTLEVALQQLVAAGVLEPLSRIEYTLTRHGFQIARQLHHGNRGAGRGALTGFEAPALEGQP
jgi:hypothetical protein